MRANSMITDKVRSALIRKDLMVWGDKQKGIINSIATSLQSMNRDGVMVFCKAPDYSYTLLHVTESYGAVKVTLEGFSDALLGSVNGRFKEGDAVRIQQKLSVLGINKSIKIKG